MTKPKAIAFDLCGVFIEFNPDYLYMDIFPDKKEREWFFKNVWTDELDLENCKGVPIEECFAVAINNYPKYESRIRAWVNRFTEMVRPMPESLKLLDEIVEKKIPIYLLSNFGKDMFSIIRPLFLLFDHFLDIILSGDVGINKPDAGYYEYFLNKYSFKPEDILFVDDRPPNVEGAKKVGMNAVQFTSADQLRNVLEEFFL